MMKMKNCLPLAAALMASALFLAACGANPPDERTPDAMVPAAEAAQSQAIRVDIQGQEVWFAPENEGYTTPAPTLMTSEFPMEFQMGEYSGWDITINGMPVTSGEMAEIQIETLSKDAPIPIVFTNQATGQAIHQTMQTLPDSFPDYNVLSNVRGGGILLY